MKILVISSNLIGDTILSTGVISFFSKQNPQAKFTFVIGPSAEPIFKNFKSLFKTKGYSINWKELEQQSLDQTINTLSMASPFSLEEKQALLETQNLISRKFKLEEIIKTYILDDFSNTTIQ